MKNTLKLAANGLARCLAAPLAWIYAAMQRVRPEEQRFANYAQALALCPGQTGVYLRRAWCWWLLPLLGKDVYIGFGTLLISPRSQVHDRVYIGPYCVMGEVTLEADVLVASHVSVINGGHQHGVESLDVPIRLQPGRFDPITIGRGSWIGERSVVMANVGKHCIVGAGTVVTRPVPDYAVVVGVPAHILRYRRGESTTALSSTTPIAQSGIH